MSTPVQSQVENSYHASTVSDSLLTNVAGGTVIILVIAACLLLAVRRLKGITPGNRLASGLSVIDSRSVGQKERLVVVDMQDKRMLLGITTGQISCLATFDRPEDDSTAEPGSAAGDFHAALSKLLKRGEQVR